MSKYLVQGKDAGAFLDNISTAKVDGPNDTITYCQWLDERGMMQADLTVTKMKDNEFMVVATDTQHQHALQHMQKRIGEKNVVVTDVTGGYGYLNLQGESGERSEPWSDATD